MNIREHLLVCLSEEAAEVIQAVSKALRFGINDRNPTLPDAISNGGNILKEVAELLAVVEMLQEEGALGPSLCDVTEVKKRRVKEWAWYAIGKGSLIDEPQTNP